MSKFLRKTMLFILPIILCLYPIDSLISKYLSKSKYFASGEIIDWNDIYNGNINSDLLIYGSSRAWVQINPTIIEDSLQISTYNLGIDGHNFWLQYLRHIELLKYNKKPKCIIFSLDVFTMQKRIDLYNYQQFLPYLLWNSDVENYTSTYIGFSTFDYNIPLVRYFGLEGALIASMHVFLGSDTPPVRIKGYRGIEKEWNDDLEKAKSETDHIEINLDSSTVKLFEQFINECKNNDIKLIFVYTPEYIGGQNFVKNREEIISIYRQLANKYDLKFIDYSLDEISMQQQYFYDTEHLNKNGSEFFTYKFIRVLKELMFDDASKNNSDSLKLKN